MDSNYRLIYHNQIIYHLAIGLTLINITWPLGLINMNMRLVYYDKSILQLYIYPTPT